MERGCNKKNTFVSGIKVIGIGGLGGCAVQHMLPKGIPDLEFVYMDMDKQELNISNCPCKLELGRNAADGIQGFYEERTHLGRISAEESREAIASILTGARIVFLIAAMGGRIGAGAIPVVAQIAKEIGIPTVSIVTMPFPFEGTKRLEAASQRVRTLSEVTDYLMVVPSIDLNMNGKITSIADVRGAFEAMEITLCQCIQSLVRQVSTSPDRD